MAEDTRGHPADARLHKDMGEVQVIFSGRIENLIDQDRIALHDIAADLRAFRIIGCDDIGDQHPALKIGRPFRFGDGVIIGSLDPDNRGTEPFDMSHTLFAHLGMQEYFALGADETGTGSDGAAVIAIGRAADGEIGAQ